MGGLLPWGVAPGANLNLSNIVNTAISASLVPAVDSNINLGAPSLYWANLYVDLVTIGNGVNGDLLILNSERSWKFTASGSGPGTELDLLSTSSDKTFNIGYGTNFGFVIRASGTATNSHVWLVPSGGKVGLGMPITSDPSADLLFGRDAAKTITLERRTTAGAGYDFFLTAGGMKAGEWSTAGGSLYLRSGISSGSNQYIFIQNQLKTGSVSSISITKGGTGYTVNDVLTLVEGNNDATITVTSVDGSGTITGVTRTNYGTGYSIMPSVGVTGGTGANATITIASVDANSDMAHSNRMAFSGYSVYSTYPLRFGTSGADIAQKNPTTIVQVSSTLNPRNTDLTNFNTTANINAVGVAAGGGTYAQINAVNVTTMASGTVSWGQALKTTVINSSGATLSTAIGNWAVIENIGSGVITDARALSTWIRSGSTTGSIGTAIDIHIISPSLTGPITTAYGINMQGRTTAGITNCYGIYIGPITATTTAIGIDMGNMIGSTAANSMAIRTYGGNIIFNEGGDANTNFRVEGDTDVSLLFTNAATDRVAIGSLGPVTRLHVLQVGATSALGAVPANRGIALTTSSSGYNRIYFENLSSTSGQRLFTLDNAAGYMTIGSLADNGGAWTTENVIAFNYDGKVSIGSHTFTEALAVLGNVDVSGVYKVDGVQVVSNRVIDARIDDVISSGDATTDGVIDAIVDCLVAHGLVAAA